MYLLVAVRGFEIFPDVLWGVNLDNLPLDCEVANVDDLPFFIRALLALYVSKFEVDPVVEPGATAEPLPGVHGATLSIVKDWDIVRSVQLFEVCVVQHGKMWTVMLESFVMAKGP